MLLSEFPKSFPISIESRSQEPSMLRCIFSTLKNRIRHPSRTFLRRFFNMKSKFWSPTWAQVGSPAAQEIHQNRSLSQLEPQDHRPEPPRPSQTRFLVIFFTFSTSLTSPSLCDPTKNTPKIGASDTLSFLATHHHHTSF